MQQHNNTDLATQARHLRDTKAAFKSVHHGEIQLLTRFLPYIYNVKKDFEGKGRAAFNDVALVCWDGMSLPIFNHFRSILFPDLQMSAERHAMGFDLRTVAGSQEYHHWLRKRPRQILENLLGPLVLPLRRRLLKRLWRSLRTPTLKLPETLFNQTPKTPVHLPLGFLIFLVVGTRCSSALRRTDLLFCACVSPLHCSEIRILNGTASHPFCNYFILFGNCLPRDAIARHNMRG